MFQGTEFLGWEISVTEDSFPFNSIIQKKNNHQVSVSIHYDKNYSNKSKVISCNFISLVSFPEKHKFATDIVRGWADQVISVRGTVKDSDWEAPILNAKKNIAPSVPAASAVSNAPKSPSSLSRVQPQPHTLSAAKKLKVDAGGDSSL